MTIKDKAMSTTTHLMTAEELFYLDDEPNRHELIKGELLTMPPTGEEHGVVNTTLLAVLYNHVNSNNLGIVYAGDTGFRLQKDPDTVLAPGIAFIRGDKPKAHSPFYRLGPPDLAVEVRSHYDRTTNVERKAALWLELGAKSVWLVNPKRRTVDVIHANGDRWLFRENEELFDDIVPGFRLTVSEIFS